VRSGSASLALRLIGAIRLPLGAAAMLLLSGNASGQGAAEVGIDPACEGQGLTVDRAFDGGSVAACTVEDDGTVTLDIRPETLPINPSPWYAVRLRQEELRARRITLRYADADHRYAPWFRVADGPWQRLAPYPVEPDKRAVPVYLPAFAGEAWLAAQPLVPVDTVTNHWAALAAAGHVSLDMTATSTDGRPVPLYRRGPADAQSIHLVATRQHPPETTGAAAFDAFARQLLVSPVAGGCTDQALLIAPMLNPDGLVRGHWRTNAGHIDTNRDWGAFATPEIRAVGQRIETLAASARIVSVLDFHSTRQGAIYVSRDSSPRAQAFASAVQDATALRVVRTRSADGNTLKSWSENRFGSESFTVELPDSATPEEAAAAGRAIADLYVAHYLCPAGARP
jgi:predicted deacylase